MFSFMMPLLYEKPAEKPLLEMNLKPEDFPDENH